MAIQTITYSNKQAMGTQPSVPEVNKITDSNMNEIKSVVNNNANFLSNNSTYSTTEQVVGTWIDGKPIYRKTIAYTGTALSSGTTSIQHNISNIGAHRQIVGSEFWYNNNMWNGVITASSYCTVNAVHNNSIDVSVSNDFAGLFSPLYITLEYTKTTD